MYTKLGHTPTPWAVHHGGDYSRILMKPGSHSDDMIAEVYSDGTGESERHDRYNREANATFIARACNAHEALVEALTNVRGIIQMIDDLEGGQIDMLSSIDAALSKARGKA